MKKILTNLFNRKKQDGKSPARLWYSIIALILAVGCIGGLAWYITRVHYIRQELQLANAELNMTVYNAAGDEVRGMNTNSAADDEYNGYINTRLTALFNEGASLSFTGGTEASMTMYAKVENKGEMDLDIYLQMVLNGNKYYDTIGEYINSCVVDITDDVTDGALDVYAANHNQHGSSYRGTVADGNTVIFEGTKLSQMEKLHLLDEVKNAKYDDGLQSTRYYRIELWATDWPTEVSSQRLDLAVLLYGKQHGMPLDDESSEEMYTVTNENELQAAITKAKAGSTIVIAADMVVTEAVTINKPVNLLVNGYTLRIKSDLSYDYLHSMGCSIKLDGSGSLVIDGNLNISTPDDFVISGSGQSNTVNLGNGISGGRVNVNAGLQPFNSSFGFHVTNVNIQTKNKGDGYQPADLHVGEQTRVIISNNTTVGCIYGNAGASNIYLNIYGKVSDGIDLHMLADIASDDPSAPYEIYDEHSSEPNGNDRIYIYVYGSVEEHQNDSSNHYRFWLPNWAKSYKNTSVYTVANCNTRIFYDLRANPESVVGYVHPLGSGASGNFVDDNIERENYDENTVIRMNNNGAYIYDDESYSNAYRIVIKDYVLLNGMVPGTNIDLSDLGTVGQFVVQQMLAKYFLAETHSKDPLFNGSTNPLNAAATAQAISQIDYLEILMVSSGGTMSTLQAGDLYYLAGNGTSQTVGSVSGVAYDYPLTGIRCLNLSQAETVDQSIPAKSMQNCIAQKVVLPIDLLTIDTDAFDGSYFNTITIPATVTDITSGAFDLNENNNADGRLFATLEREGDIPLSIIGGFDKAKHWLFVNSTTNALFQSHFPITRNDWMVVDVSTYNGIDWQWRYHVYEYATMATNTVDANGNRTIVFAREIPGGVETALIVVSKPADYSIINEVAEYETIFPTTLLGQTVVGVGDRAFSNLGTKGISSFTMDLDFNGDDHSLVDLSKYYRIGKEVFACYITRTTVPNLKLGNLTEIDELAFAVMTVTKQCAARPATFTGMTLLGRGAFGALQLGALTPNQADADALTYSTYGTLDLSFQKDLHAVPDDYVLYGSTIVGSTVLFKNAGELNSTHFYTAKFYTCKLDVTNVDVLRYGTLVDRTAIANGKVVYPQCEVIAVDVPHIEPNAFSGHFKKLTVGLQSTVRTDENIADNPEACWGGNYVNGTTTVTGYCFGYSYIGSLVNDQFVPDTSGYETSYEEFIVDGNIPVNSSAYVFAFNRSCVVGSFTITSRCRSTTIPEHAFHSTYDIIQNLNIETDTITEIGQYAFYYATIGNEEFDFSGINIGIYAFYNTKFPRTTKLTVNDANIGANAFETASLPLVTELSADGSFIDGAAFHKITFSALQTLSLVDVTNVGATAFYECSMPQLQTATLVVDGTDGGIVGSQAFSNGNASMTWPSTAVFQVTLKNMTGSFGSSAFKYNPAILSFTLKDSDGVTLEKNMFVLCPQMTAVSFINCDDLIFASDNSEAYSVVKNCTSLTFKDCKNFSTGNYFANSNTRLQSLNFDNCENFTFGNYAFQSSTVQTVTMHNCSGFVYGTNAFLSCTSLTTNSWEGLVRVGNASFKNCTGLTVFQCSTLSALVDSLFENDTNLEYVNIPAALIDKSAVAAYRNCTGLRVAENAYNFRIERCTDAMFDGCTALAAWIIHTENQDVGNEGFSYYSAWGRVIGNSNARIFVGDSYVTRFYTSQGHRDQVIGIGSGTADQLVWVNDTNDTVTGHFSTLNGEPMSKYGLGDYLYAVNEDGTATLLAFFADSISGDYRIPDSVGTASTGALARKAYFFTEFAADTTVTAPSTMTSVGEKCFYQKANLTAFTMTGGCQVDAYAFAECFGLTTLTLGSGGDIGSYAFSNDYSLATITCSCTSAGDYAFNNCSSLKAFESTAMTKAGTYCFNGCSSLVYVYCPALGDFSSSSPYTFKDCTSLRLVETSLAFNYTKLCSIMVGCSSMQAWIIHTENNPITTNNMDCGFYSTNSYAENLFGGANHVGHVPFRIVVNDSYDNRFNKTDTDYTFKISVPVEVNQLKWADNTVDTSVSHFTDADGNNMSTHHFGDYLYYIDQNGEAVVICDFRTVTGETALPATLPGDDGPAAVTALQNAAYAGQGEMTAIQIPNVNRLGKYCFSQCKALKGFTSDKVTAAGIYCFNGCIALEYVKCPKLGEFSADVPYTFNGCTGLLVAETSLDYNYAKLGYLFQGCTALRAWVIQRPSDPAGTNNVNCNISGGNENNILGRSGQNNHVQFRIVVNSTESARFTNTNTDTTKLVSAPSQNKTLLWADNTADTVAHFTDSDGVSMSEHGFGDYLYCIDENGHAVILYDFRNISGATTVNETLPSATGTATVNGLANYCYCGQTGITAVELSNVQTAGDYCFNGCTALQTVTVNELQTAGSYCFNGCSSLKQFVSNTLKKTDKGCFCGCSAMVYVYCPSLEDFSIRGAETFYGCTNLVIAETALDFTQPTNSRMFYGCVNLRAWIIHTENKPTGTQNFESFFTTGDGGNLFGSNGHLNHVPFRVFINSAYIGKLSTNFNKEKTQKVSVDVAFTQLKWADDTTGLYGHFTDAAGTQMSTYGYGDYLYYQDENGQAVIVYDFRTVDGALTVPATLPGDTGSAQVTGLAEKCYMYQTGITSVDLSGVETAGNYCFGYCTGVTQITNSVLTTAGSYCFTGCTALSAFESDTLQKVGSNGFNGCSAMEYVRCPKLEDFSERYGQTFFGCTNLLIAETGLNFQYWTNSRMFSGCNKLRAWIIHTENHPTVATQFTTFFSADTENLFGSNGHLNHVPFRIIINSAYANSILNTNVGCSGLISLPVEANELLWADETSETVTHFTDAAGNNMSTHGFGDYLYAIVNDTPTLLYSLVEDLQGTYTVPQTLGGKTVTALANFSYKGVTCGENAGIVIPEGVKTVGDYAFANTNATSISIPTTLTGLGSNTFEGSGSIRSIFLNTDVSHTTPATAVTATKLYGSDTSPTDIVVYLDRNAYDNVYTAAKWGGIPKSQFFVSDKIVTVEDFIFYLDPNEQGTGYNITMVTGGSGQVSVPFPSTFTDGAVTKNILAISSGAFEVLKDNPTVSQLVLPDYLVDFYVDYNKMPRSLAAYVISDSNTKFKTIDGVLYSKDGTTLVNYPRGKAETAYTIPAGVTSAASNCFVACNNLTTVIAQSDIRFAGNLVTDCPNLVSLDLRNVTGCVFIGTNTFTNVNGDFHILIPIGSTAQYKKNIFVERALEALLQEMDIPVSAVDWEFEIVEGVKICLVRYLGTLPAEDGGAVTLAVPASLTDGGTTYTVTQLGPKLLGGKAFTAVSIPDSVTSVDVSLFDGSTVGTVTVAAGNTAYSVAESCALVSRNGKTLFRIMPAATGNIVLQYVENVACDALRGCAVSSIQLDSLAVVSDGAFAGYAGIVDLTGIESVPVLLGTQCFTGYGAAVTPIIRVSSGMYSMFLQKSGYSAIADLIMIWPPLTTTQMLAAAAPEATGWLYRQQGDTVILTALQIVDGVVTLPAQLDGYPVAGLDTTVDTSAVTAFAVEQGSAWFTADADGVLYNADGSLLVRFPAGSSLTSYAVPENAAIAERAFAGAVNLRCVTISGFSLRNMGAYAFAGTSDQLALAAGQIELVTTQPETETDVDVQGLKCLGIITGEQAEDRQPEPDPEPDPDEQQSDAQAQAPAEQAPAEETPVEEPPAEQPQEEQAPAQETPVEQTPAEQNTQNDNQ